MNVMTPDLRALTTRFPFHLRKFVTPEIEVEAAKLIAARVKAERHANFGERQSLGFTDKEVLDAIGNTEVAAADLAVPFNVSTTTMMNRLRQMLDRGLVEKSGDRHRGVFWRAAE